MVPAGQESCIDDNDLIALLEERVSAVRRAQVQRHAATCLACAQLLLDAGIPASDERIGASDLATPLAEGGAARRGEPPRVFDDFVVERMLGRGGMGEVHLARQRSLDRQVAIKFIDALPQPAQRERFLREARVIARLSHPNVVTVHQVGESAGRPYLVSEYVDGRSLDQLETPLPAAQVLELGLGLAAGLAAAHKAQVVHRDIKPANAILGRDGRVRLLDFGLAKLVSDAGGAPVGDAPAGDAPADAAALHLTTTGAVLGTPRYMAPEAWEGPTSDPRADVFSLGLLLYQLASGRLPFAGESLVALRYSVSFRNAPPLRRHAPRVPRALAAVVDRCLQREPSRRYASAVELHQALSGVRLPRWPRWAGGAVLALTVAGLFGGWLLLPTDPYGREVALAGGTFLMGSDVAERQSAQRWCQREERDPAQCRADLFEREGPQQAVMLSPFSLDATEVSNERFAAFLNSRPGLRLVRGDGTAETSDRSEWVIDADGQRLADLYPSYSPPYGISSAPGPRFQVRVGLARRPVRQVTWFGALRYCAARGARLPTEAEWELAARGTAGARFPWGEDEPRCQDVVFARGPGQPCAALGTALPAVGSSPFDRTPTGVYDLGGSLSEWVADPFTPRYAACPAGCVDPGRAAAQAAAQRGGGPAGTQYIFRGGNYGYYLPLLRAAGRGRWQGEVGLHDVGFRCARDRPARAATGAKSDGSDGAPREPPTADVSAL